MQSPRDSGDLMAANPEPKTLTAGDTARWLKTLSTFQIDDDTSIDPVTDGWTLKYHFRGPGAIDITATVSGSDYLVNVAPGTTANWTTGHYLWEAYISKDSDRYKVDTGVITILANLAAIAAPYDGRTHAKKMLDAIEAVLEGRASSEIASYTEGGRSVTKIPHDELLAIRSRYQQEYFNELAAQRIADGLGSRRNIYVRFQSPS